MVKPIFENKEIEKIFMPYIEAGFPSRKDFGEKFINGIKHWWYPKEEVKKSYLEDRILVLDLEFGSKCGLKCPYCYRTADIRDKTTEKEITLDEWIDLIDQASEMGVKGVKLIGAGEFFEDKRFMSALEYLTTKGIKVVSFTAGYVLDDEKKIKKLYGMSPDDIIDFLYKNDHTIFIKADSFKPELMDNLVGRKGFTNARNNVLKKLLEKGFTKESPTRLGLEVQANIYTLPELLDIDKLKNYLNIYSDMVTSMPCGLYTLRAKKGESIDLTLEQKKELYKSIYEQNVKFKIPFDKISPFIGGLCCTQLGNGLYVNVEGEVYACPGCFKKIGNVREGLRNVWLKHKERKKYQKDSYICPPRESSLITPTKLYNEIGEKFL